jgi:uncharacterized cupin superfamily protein
MKIIKKNEVLNVKKPNGPEVWYYLFPEYEVHYNEQPPQTTQTWHMHEKILETLFIIDGELIAKWKEGETIKQEILRSGDLVETEHSDHTFENRTDSIVRFLVIKQVLSGDNRSEILKNDKIITA